MIMTRHSTRKQLYSIETSIVITENLVKSPA